ncbi:MAG: hypothetical protein AB7H86_19160 [Blastocatellales bacterium]
MEAGLQELLAFHLSGRRTGNGLEAFDGKGLRPALMVGYRDLSELRYDYPLVLVRNAPADRTCVQPLSGIVDDLVHRIAQGDDGDRLIHHALRIERQIRKMVADGAPGTLTELWDAAAGSLSEDDLLKDSLSRARAALTVDGEVIDCDSETPERLFRHVWTAMQESRSRRMREDIGRLIQKLTDILRADFAHSSAGLSPETLRAGVGTAHVDIFDFEAMSRILGRSSTGTGLSHARRQRIEGLLKVLENQQFFGGSNGKPGWSFIFDDCAAALAAWRERMPKAVELARAIAVAELEIDAQYNESRHDDLFADFGAFGLDEQELERFPGYLICVGQDRLHGEEHEMLMEILSAGLPMKVLVRTDDILEEPSIGGDSHLAFGQRARQISNMAIGLNDVFVMQAPGSHLLKFRDRILKGLGSFGPALFSVYSGAGEIPPYLKAAAALESRVFPAFTYDPSAGGNWAARFDIESNPQFENDWPVQRFEYEDREHQRKPNDVPFTLIDFVAIDSRYARHFAVVSDRLPGSAMVSVDRFLNRTGEEQVPFIFMVNDKNMLVKVIADEKLVRAALRCRESWHSLQELGGIHNSHAERLLERERQALQEQPEPEAPAQATPSVAEPEPTAAVSSDDPWIETARCTTCNECTGINNRMFAYNENKQAYIKDPDAGTYRELVLAAESCQLAIIHPGKPRNPNEPGLDEWVARAAPFL